MVTRVHKNRTSRYIYNSDTCSKTVPKGRVLEMEGRSELIVQVGIDGTQYKDWISIKNYEGSIKFKGNHVHELVTAILRFSSKGMRDNYKTLLTLTDHATGSKPYQPEPFTDFDIEWEKKIRKNEKEWNENQEEKIMNWSLNETS